MNKSLYIFLAALLLAAVFITLLPTDDMRRRRWYLASVRRELFRAVEGRSCWFRRSVEESSFRASDRLSQIAGLKYRDDAERAATVAYALHLSDVTFAARRTRNALVKVGGRAGRNGLAALAGLDVTGLRMAAAKLGMEPGGRWAKANADRLAALVEHYGSDIALARQGRAP